MWNIGKNDGNMDMVFYIIIALAIWYYMKSNGKMEFLSRSGMSRVSLTNEYMGPCLGSFRKWYASSSVNDPTVIANSKHVTLGKPHGIEVINGIYKPFWMLEEASCQPSTAPPPGTAEPVRIFIAPQTFAPTPTPTPTFAAPVLPPIYSEPAYSTIYAQPATYATTRPNTTAAPVKFIIQPPFPVSASSSKIEGRYVRIRQPNVGCFNLSEIQVFSNGANVAQNKPVKQSSVYNTNYPPSNLTDGVLTNIAHSSCKDAASMVVDLGAVYPIDSIVAYTRPSYSNRVLGAYVEILDDTIMSIWKSKPFSNKKGSTKYANFGDTGIKKHTMILPSSNVVPS